MNEETEIGNIDYTRIDVDKTASYASLEGGSSSSPAAGRESGAATRTISPPRARSR